jgi:hypothetical protein
LTKQETALVMKTIWEGLLAPRWLKDDLIELGKLVYSKVPLREVDSDVFERLFPNLTQVAQHVGKTLRQQLHQESSPAPSPSPAPAAPPKPQE